MEKLDVVSLASSYKKDAHIGLGLTIGFAASDVICIVLFSVLAKWQYQTLLSVIGSVIASIFGVLCLFFFLALYLPAFHYQSFYADLALVDEETCSGEIISVTKKKETVKRDIACRVIKIADRDLYLLDDADFIIGKTYDFSLKGNYVMGAKIHED